MKNMRKNKIKKTGMGFAALALISAAALPVSATENTNTQSGNMNVQATVVSDYTLTVPKEVVNIPYGQTNTNLKITVSGNIEEGKTISVTTADGSLILGTKGLLPYTITNKQLTWNDTELDNGGEDGVEKTTILTISQEDWKAAKAGTYNGTVTFTAKLNDIES